MVQSNEVNLIVSAKDLASRTFQKIERNLNKMEQTANKTGKATQGTTQSMGALGAAVAGVGAVFASAEFGRLAIEFANLGESVRNTTNRFEDLVGGSIAAENALARMRTATRYIADDASLMQGASDLLLMGIANTAQQAEQIVSLAIGLKRSTDSAADAINNFAIMMGNQSYLRLDSFGISAGRTRERVEELMKTAQAATREEAFTMAVLEIGQETLERTSLSIDETSTAFKRFKTDWINTTASVGVATEQMANNVLGHIELIVLGLTNQTEKLEQIDRINSRVLLGAANNVTQLAANQQREISQLIHSTAYEDMQELQRQRRAYEDFGTPYTLTDAQIAEIMLNYTNYTSRLSNLLGVEEMVFSANHTAIRQILRDKYDVFTLQNNKMLEEMELSNQQQQQEQQRAQNQRLQTEIANFESAQNTYNRLLLQGRIDGGFFDSDTYYLLNAAQLAMADSARIITDIYREGGSVTEKMMNDINQAANGAERGANEAFRMVEAFRNMNLSQLMGETGDVSLSEIGRMVTDSLGNTDLTAAFTNALDTLSGARTELTNFMENDIVPLIAEVARTKGPEAAAQFAQEIDKALSAAIALELGPGETADLLAQILGIDVNVPQEDAINVTVPFVPTWQDVARVTGADTSAIEQALGLEEGTITLSNAITVDIPNVAFGDFATALGAEPGSALRSNLQFLIFGDNNTMSIDDEITINASRVTWGQIADWYGMSLEQLISRLPAEAFGTGQPTPNTFALPGTYSIGGGNLGAMGPGMPFASRYSGGPFGNVDWSQPGSLFQEKLPQSELDILVTRATDLETKLAEAANTDFTMMNSQLATVSDETTEIASQLDYITRSTWVIPVKVEFDASSVPENFRDSLQRAVQDNGGVTPGSRPGGR